MAHDSGRHFASQFPHQGRSVGVAGWKGAEHTSQSRQPGQAHFCGHGSLLSAHHLPHLLHEAQFEQLCQHTGASARHSPVRPHATLPPPPGPRGLPPTSTHPHRTPLRPRPRARRLLLRCVPGPPLKPRQENTASAPVATSSGSASKSTSRTRSFGLGPKKPAGSAPRPRPVRTSAVTPAHRSDASSSRTTAWPVAPVAPATEEAEEYLVDVDVEATEHRYHSPFHGSDA